MKREAAIRATKNGAMAAAFSAILMTMLFLAGAFIGKSEKLLRFSDPSILLDILIFLVCAYGMNRQSRACSVFIFVYYLVSQISLAVDTNKGSVLFVSFIFLYLYGRAVFGSFAFHALEMKENKNYKINMTKSYLLGIPSYALLAFYIYFEISQITGLAPSIRVQSGAELSNSNIEELINSGIVSENERIVYFYADGGASILESGNILTNERVIAYFTDEENSIQVYGFQLDEVTEVIEERRGDFHNDSTYIVKSKSENDWLRLYLSPEQGGDKKFVSDLRKRCSL